MVTRSQMSCRGHPEGHRRRGGLAPTVDPRGPFSSSHSTLVIQAELKAAMRRQVLHDPLTDLPNRMYLEDRAGSALQGRPVDEPLVLLMIDLDEFKQVNDRLGHARGDLLLQEIARRLQEALDDDVGNLVGHLAREPAF
jgi:GGDEF domain-containing protein